MLVPIPIPRPQKGKGTRPGINIIPGRYHFAPGNIFPRQSFQLGTIRIEYISHTNGRAVYDVKAVEKKPLKPEDLATATEFILALADPASKAYRELSAKSVVISVIIIALAVFLLIKLVRR